VEKGGRQQEMGQKERESDDKYIEARLFTTF